MAGITRGNSCVRKNQNLTERTLKRGNKRGNVRETCAIFISPEYLKRLMNYIPGAKRVYMEEETRRNLRLIDLAKSKAMSKNWPNSIANIKEAQKEKELEEKKIMKKKKDKFYEQIFRENRAPDRKALADAKGLIFYDRPEVRELHAARALCELPKKWEVQLKSKSNREKDEEVYEAEDKDLLYLGGPDRNEERMARNREFWKAIDKQVEEDFERKCIDKLENKRIDSEVVKRIKCDLMANLCNKEKLKEEQRGELIRALESGKLDKNLLKAEKTEEEERQYMIRMYDAESLKIFEEAKKPNKDMVERIPGEAARRKVQKDARERWEKEVQEDKKERKRLYENGLKDKMDRGNERMMREERLIKERAAEFKSVNDRLQKEKIQKKVESQQTTFLERLKLLKLAEVEEIRRLKKGPKVKQAVLREGLKEQIDAKLSEKLGKKKQLEEFIAADRAKKERNDHEFMEYANKLIENAKSQGMIIKPLEVVIGNYNRKKTHKEVDIYHSDYAKPKGKL